MKMNRYQIAISAVLLFVTLLVCVAPSVDLNPTALRARQKADQVFLSLLAMALIASVPLLRMPVHRSYSSFREIFCLLPASRMGLPETTGAFRC